MPVQTRQASRLLLRAGVTETLLDQTLASESFSTIEKEQIRRTANQDLLNSPIAMMDESEEGEYEQPDEEENSDSEGSDYHEQVPVAKKVRAKGPRQPVPGSAKKERIRNGKRRVMISVLDCLDHSQTSVAMIPSPIIPSSPMASAVLERVVKVVDFIVSPFVSTPSPLPPPPLITTTISKKKKRRGIKSKARHSQNQRDAAKLKYSTTWSSRSSIAGLSVRVGSSLEAMSGGISGIFRETTTGWSGVNAGKEITQSKEQIAMDAFRLLNRKEREKWRCTPKSEAKTQRWKIFSQAALNQRAGEVCQVIPYVEGKQLAVTSGSDLLVLRTARSTWITKTANNFYQALLGFREKIGRDYKTKLTKSTIGGGEGRGNHQAMQIGMTRDYSKKPHPTKLHRDQKKEVEELIENPDFNILNNHIASIIKRNWPNLYQFMKKTDLPIVSKMFGVHNLFCWNDLFSTGSGSKVKTTPHLDSKNNATGVCTLYAHGTFDHTKTNLLVLLGIGIILEVPAGCFVFYPSALIIHWNVDLFELDQERVLTLEENDSSIPGFNSNESRISFVWFSQSTVAQYMHNDGKAMSELIANEKKNKYSCHAFRNGDEAVIRRVRENSIESEFSGSEEEEQGI